MTEEGRRAGFLPAWWFAAAYAVLLLCIPTRLIVGPFGAPGTPANLFAIALLLWWVCAQLGGLTSVRGVTPLRIATGLLLTSVLVSFSSGHFRGWTQPANIHQRTDRRWQAASTPEVISIVSSAADRGLLALAGWMGIMLLTAEGMRSWRDLEKLVSWIAAAGAVVAAMGVVQYFTRINVASFVRIPGLTSLLDFGEALSRSQLNRIVSTSAHPIELGVAMASILPLALHVALHSRKVLPWVTVGLLGAAALMSVSRSAIVVAGVALFVLWLGWPVKQKLIALAVAPVLALGARAAFPGLLGSITSLFRGLSGDPSITGRTDDYPLIFGLIADSPLFGQGLFTFVPTVYRTVDNQGLILLLELGIVGTVAFVGLVITLVVGAWHPSRHGGTPRQAHLGMAASASTLGIITSYVTFDALSFRQVAGLTFLYLGLCGAVWQLSRFSEATSTFRSPTEPSASPVAPRRARTDEDRRPATP